MADNARPSFAFSDPRLEPLAQKTLRGQWLDLNDGLLLLSTPDIHGVGKLADWVRQSLHGDKTYYNRNRHINYTNVCALSCKFCSFYRKRGEEGAYEMPLEQVISVAKKAADDGATEVHIVGGLHPWLKFDYYLDMLRGIRNIAPQLHVKAFTAIEIIHFTKIARLSIREVLLALKEAGLGSLPGGGAEIFDDRVHDEVFKGKVREDKWFEVHRTAHSVGLFSNATMLYGHVETPSERVGHLIKLRELQAESLKAAGLDGQIAPPPSPSPSTANADIGNHENVGKYFNCLIPLSFIPDGSELGHLPGPTGLSDLRTLALTRLMVPNVRHVKAFWIMQTPMLAQLALDWGCDDLDGTVVWYDITKREGHGTTHQEMHEKQLRRLIFEARKTPVERDTLYRPMIRPSGATSQSADGDVASAARPGSPRLQPV